MTVHSIAGPEVDASYLKITVDQGVQKFGDRFDASDLESAAHFAPYYWRNQGTSAGLRLKVHNTRYDYTRTGTVGKTTGHKPAWLLMHRSNDTGSSDVLGPDDEIVETWNGRRYEPVRKASEFEKKDGKTT